MAQLADQPPSLNNKEEEVEKNNNNKQVENKMEIVEMGMVEENGVAMESVMMMEMTSMRNRIMSMLYKRPPSAIIPLVVCC